MATNTEPGKNESVADEKLKGRKEIILFENLELPQKIIFSTSCFAITFIICFVIAHKIDHNNRLTKTWMVWLVFILIQAWLQNKFWATNGRLVFSFKLPLFSPYKQWAKAKEASSTSIKKVLSITKMLVIPLLLATKKYYIIIFIILFVITSIYLTLIYKAPELTEQSWMSPEQKQYYRMKELLKQEPQQQQQYEQQKRWWKIQEDESARALERNHPTNRK